jgi:hypothetical protein
MTSNSLNLRHLISFEHADFDQPRTEHGYCVDDVARASVLLERSNTQDPQLRDLIQTYFDFISEAQSIDGHFANRCNVSGTWTSPAEMGDHWGRALWALGTTANRDPDRELAKLALLKFDFSAYHRTHHLRSMAYLVRQRFSTLNPIMLPRRDSCETRSIPFIYQATNDGLGLKNVSRMEMQ